MRFSRPRYKCKKNTADAMEDAINIYKIRTEAWLKVCWESRGSIKFVTRADLGMDPRLCEWHQLPQELRNQQCFYFDEADITVKTISFADFFTSTLSQSRSMIIAGDAGAFKSTTLHAALRVHAVVVGRSYYCVVQDLDHFGALTMQGKMADSAAYAADDVNLTSRNGVALTTNEVKQLFEVQRDSSIGCRYRSAQFHGGVVKMFATQWADDVDPTMDTNSFQLRLPWMNAILNSDNDRLSRLNEDNKAIARRIVVCRIRRTNHNDKLRESLKKSSETELMSRNVNREQLMNELLGMS